MKEYAMQIYNRNLRELVVDGLMICEFSFFERYQMGEVMIRVRDDHLERNLLIVRYKIFI